MIRCLQNSRFRCHNGITSEASNSRCETACHVWPLEHVWPGKFVKRFYWLVLPGMKFGKMWCIWCGKNTQCFKKLHGWFRKNKRKAIYTSRKITKNAWIFLGNGSEIPVKDCWWHPTGSKVTSRGGYFVFWCSWKGVVKRKEQTKVGTHCWWKKSG